MSDADDMPDFGDMGDGQEAEDMDEGLDMEDYILATLDDGEEGEQEQEQAAPLEEQAAASPPSAPAAIPSPAPSPGPTPPSPATTVPAFALPRNEEGDIDQDLLDKQQRKAFEAIVAGLLTEEQAERYSAFRRSNVKMPMIKLIAAVTGNNPKGSDGGVVAMSSIVKSLVGELVTEALKVADQRGDSGPLQPTHIHAAFQQLKAQGKVETARPKLRLR